MVITAYTWLIDALEYEKKKRARVGLLVSLATILLYIGALCWGNIDPSKAVAPGFKTRNRW